MEINRREFIGKMSSAAAIIPFNNMVVSALTVTGEPKYPVAYFTKPLDNFEIDFISDTLADAGINGFDLTVRPGGIVEPDRINDQLPGIIEAGLKYGLKTEMMVTGINSAEDKNTKSVLETAARYGIKHYRLGYYSYDFKTGIKDSLGQIRGELNKLARLNGELGIQAGYQNHAGTRFGASIWDIWNVINDLPSHLVSCQFDVRHAVTEGSSSWILALHLLKNNIGSLAIKDFTWEVSGGKARVVNVPLGEGILDFDLFFKTIKELKITAPVTLHTEYPLLSKDEEDLPLLQKQKIIMKKIKTDVDFIQSYLNKYQLI